jgi:hypothetical protein
MEQVSGVSRCFIGFKMMEKELSKLFIVPHSFRGKFKKSDFNSGQVSSFLRGGFISCLLPGPIRFFFVPRIEYLWRERPLLSDLVCTQSLETSTLPSLYKDFNVKKKTTAWMVLWARRGSNSIPFGDSRPYHPLSGTSMGRKKRPFQVSLVGAKRLELPTSSM